MIPDLIISIDNLNTLHIKIKLEKHKHDVPREINLNTLYIDIKRI